MTLHRFALVAVCAVATASCASAPEGDGARDLDASSGLDASSTSHRDASAPDLCALLDYAQAESSELTITSLRMDLGDGADLDGHNTASPDDPIGCGLVDDGWNTGEGIDNRFVLMLSGLTELDSVVRNTNEAWAARVSAEPERHRIFIEALPDDGGTEGACARLRVQLGGDAVSTLYGRAEADGVRITSGSLHVSIPVVLDVAGLRPTALWLERHVGGFISTERAVQLYGAASEQELREHTVRMLYTEEELSQGSVDAIVRQNLDLRWEAEEGCDAMSFAVRVVAAPASTAAE